MTPNLTLYNAPHQRLINPVFARQLALGNPADGISRSYVSNRTVRQFSSVAFLSLRDAMATFAFHVTHVVRVGSKPQMLRVATRWVIAGVTNIKTVSCDRARQLIGKSVRQHCFSSKPERSVAAPNNTGSPKPALIRPFPVHFRPKSFTIFRKATHRYLFTKSSQKRQSKTTQMQPPAGNAPVAQETVPPGPVGAANPLPQPMASTP